MTTAGDFAAERAELDRILERLARAARELDDQVREQAADLARRRAEWAAEDGARARQARRGDLGPEWQRLQRRIDLHETSLAAVVSGRDDSAEAVEIRRRASARAAELYAEQVAALQADEPDELAEALTATRAGVDRLRAAMESAAALGNRAWGSIGLAEVRSSAPLDGA